MRELRRAAHTVYSLHYHFVFTTNYRKPVLVGEIGHSVRDLIREICRSEDIEILQGHVRPDHVHLLLSAPPAPRDRKSTRLNSSHLVISYAVFCLKKKNTQAAAASRRIRLIDH